MYVTFIVFGFPLTEVSPVQDYPFEINLDKGTMYDGGADDNYFLHFFQDVQNYTDKKKRSLSGMELLTEGRAKQIIEYMKNVLQDTTSIELWHVWLMDYYEFEDRPVIHRQTVSIDELTTNISRKLMMQRFGILPTKCIQIDRHSIAWK